MKRNHKILISLLLFTSVSLSSPVAVLTQPLAPRTAVARVSTPSPLTLPLHEGSLRIAVFGDTGSGKETQYEVGRMMNTYQITFPFETVLMVGDNIYGSDKAADMRTKFEDVYKPMIDKGVKFYAALGNHDSSNQRYYELFNMKGEEYYRFEKNGVAFYALNSNYMDRRQLDWLIAKLAADTSKWKIAYFHHPSFSSGGFHGSSKKIREALHPLFLQHGVSVVFTGHDHFYERIKPQDGIQYFVAGSGGQLRKGDVKRNSPLTDKAFDADLAFMLAEIWKDEMHFQVLSRTGQTVDSGVIIRRNS
jgi:predicted phosphodiesterase